MTYAFDVCFGKSNVALMKLGVCLFVCFYFSFLVFWGFVLGGGQLYQNQFELGLHEFC
jgi:hypothetical protein